MLQMPTWFEEANWIWERPTSSDPSRPKLPNERQAFLQLVHARQYTEGHVDNNGTDTIIKVLAGLVLTACWSQSLEPCALGADGRLEDRKIDGEGCDDGGGRVSVMDWKAFKSLPSARLFLVRKGDVVFLPAGTFHYVYTVETKVAVAVDFMNGLGWQRREAAVARDRRIDPKAKEGIGPLPELFRHGVLHIERPRVQKAVDEGQQPSPGRRAELQAILDWGVKLDKETPAHGTAKGPPWPTRDPDVRKALNLIYGYVNPWKDA